MSLLLRANACRAALTLVLLGAGGAAEAGCRPDVPIAPVLLQQYLATPATLLYADKQDTDALRVHVLRLAPADPDAVKAILSIVAQASHGQQLAIGRGLAEAARFCTAQDSAIVQRIKSAVRMGGNSVVKQSFVASYEQSGDNDAGATSSSSVETRHLATGRDGQSPQSLLPDDPASSGKLPNPFGAPDEWR